MLPPLRIHLLCEATSKQLHCPTTALRSARGDSGHLNQRLCHTRNQAFILLRHSIPLKEAACGFAGSPLFFLHLLSFCFVALPSRKPSAPSPKRISSSSTGSAIRKSRPMAA